MPKSIPDGLTQQHVLMALKDLDEGIEHSFGGATGYHLLHDGNAYAPKAVIGIAFRHLNGTILDHGEFSGGEQKGQANFVLRELGFSVEPITDQSGSGNDQKAASEKLVSEGYFDPTNAKDERDRKLREIVQRRGQPKFREDLIAAYGGKCAVTGCDVVQALEAAHISPYLGDQSNHVSNGLLLRADIHTLFDLGLFAIEPSTLKVKINDSLKGSSVGDLHDQELTVPNDAASHPSIAAFEFRWQQFQQNGMESKK